MKKKANHEKAPRTPFGTMLRDARKKQKLSQIEVEEKLPVSPKHMRRLLDVNASTFVSSWELGERLPPAKMLPRLAEILALPVEDLALACIATRIIRATQTALREMGHLVPKELLKPTQTGAAE